MDSPASRTQEAKILKVRADTDRHDESNSSRDGSSQRIGRLPHNNASYVENPVLCALCADLSCHKLRQECNFFLGSSDLGVEHQPSFRALNVSAAKGCHICQLFRMAYLDYLIVLTSCESTGEAPSGHRPRWNEAIAIDYCEHRDDHLPGSFVVRLAKSMEVDEWFGLRYRRCCYESPGELDSFRESEGELCYEELYIYEDEDFSRGGPLLPLSCSEPAYADLRPALGRGWDWDYELIRHSLVADTPSFGMCSSWIHLCSEKHMACGPLKTRPLPTRLVDVGGNQNAQPKLVETDGQEGQYLTLSHCWGNARLLSTKRGTYKKHLLRLEFDFLPKTFQDAITVTRTLGFRYIWIDSLCIVQDEPEDWEYECARMDQTYENSALTIAVPNANDSSVGFLGKRPTSSILPCAFPDQDAATSGESNLQLSAVSWLSREDLHSPFDSALGRRGWVLQERLLSPRILFFGRAQLYWECREDAWFESYRFQLERLHERRKYSRQPKQYLLKYDFHARYLDDASWRRVVECYSETQLTNAYDKLPALSGIARRFSKGRADTYLAGLWRRDLLKWLLWAARGSPSCRAIVPNRGPSWTWAKLDGPVFYSYDVDFERRFDPIDAEIIDARVVAPGLDAFGRVLSGTIVLQGRLRHLITKKPTKKWRSPILMSIHEPRVTGWPNYDDDDGDKTWLWWSDNTDPRAWFDFEGSFHVICLLLLLTSIPETLTRPGEEWSRICWHGLTLEPVNGESSTFQRTGMINMQTRDPSDYHKRHWQKWYETEQREITLV